MTFYNTSMSSRDQPPDDVPEHIHVTQARPLLITYQGKSMSDAQLPDDVPQHIHFKGVLTFQRCATAHPCRQGPSFTMQYHIHFTRDLDSQLCATTHTCHQGPNFPMQYHITSMSSGAQFPHATAHPCHQRIRLANVVPRHIHVTKGPPS